MIRAKARYIELFPVDKGRRISRPGHRPLANRGRFVPVISSRNILDLLAEQIEEIGREEENKG